MPLPLALDHVNLWLLEDGNGWTTVDTGFALESIREAWLELLAGRRLTRQFVTHYHPDHLGLAAWLQELTGAPLWMTQAEYSCSLLLLHEIAGYSTAAMIEAFRAHGLPEPRLEKLARKGNTYALGVPAIPSTFRPIFEAEEITIGPHRWRVLIGHGHSPEHACLYCADLGVLISGDLLLPRISTNISALAPTPALDPLGLFLASLERFTQLPADTLVLPSHGLPFRGLHKRIGQLRLHHAQRCQVLLEACAQAPKHASELIPVLFDRDITDAFQSMFAMGEAIAHLVHLEQAGSLVRSVESGIIRFGKP
jgi:glyoxylase-like metal-dependent hydrolase (beta-lactamase superfamily II)